MTYNDRHYDHLARHSHSLSCQRGLRHKQSLSAWNESEGELAQETLLPTHQATSKPATVGTKPITTAAMTITTLEPPRCPTCYEHGIRQIVNGNNPNGNAGRPYYICDLCDRFICFDDQRGISPANPRCRCGRYTRRQIAGTEKEVPHGIHYVCARGWCSFYSEEVDQDGVQRRVPARLVGTCSGYSYI